MEALRHHAEGTLTQDDLLVIFAIVESCLLRRTICEVPTNAINKDFLTLDNDIIPPSAMHGTSMF